jgi:hypothetical protein
MVAFIPALVGGIMSIFALVHMFKPRLPAYSFQIIKFPRFKWINGQIKSRLGADVKMRNDNFVPIDVHGLTFDLFYPDWQGSLTHIARVQDVHQNTQQTQSQQQSKQPTSTASTTAIKSIKPIAGGSSVVPKHQRDDSSSSKQEITIDSLMETAMVAASASAAPLMWALLPRQSFETTDDVFVQAFGNYKVFSSLGWDLIRNGGTLMVPSSGVLHLHIKVAAAPASMNIPITLSILCDNMLDTWTMEMQGVDCELDTIDMGWADITKTAERLQEYVLRELQGITVPTATVVVVQDNDNNSVNGNGEAGAAARHASVLAGGKKKQQASFHEQLARMVRRVEWRDAKTILAV